MHHENFLMMVSSSLQNDFVLSLDATRLAMVPGRFRRCSERVRTPRCRRCRHRFARDGFGRARQRRQPASIASGAESVRRLPTTGGCRGDDDRGAAADQRDGKRCGDAEQYVSARRATGHEPGYDLDDRASRDHVDRYPDDARRERAAGGNHDHDDRTNANIAAGDHDCHHDDYDNHRSAGDLDDHTSPKIVDHDEHKHYRPAGDDGPR